MTPSVWVYVLIFLGPSIALVLLIDQAWIFIARRRGNHEAVPPMGKRMMLIATVVGGFVLLCTGIVMVIEEVRAFIHAINSPVHW
ncbi:hypothetical protein [Bradyrhizobium sp. B120]|uniref:hypothetical protein n=1 Tax=Bradyrhizobium sp. B120 TaxID=3410088 RepID=UPI003B9807FB